MRKLTVKLASARGNLLATGIFGCAYSFGSFSASSIRCTCALARGRKRGFFANRSLCLLGTANASRWRFLLYKRTFSARLSRSGCRLLSAWSKRRNLKLFLRAGSSCSNLLRARYFCLTDTQTALNVIILFPQTVLLMKAHLTASYPRAKKWLVTMLLKSLKIGKSLSLRLSQIGFPHPKQHLFLKNN